MADDIDAFLAGDDSAFQLDTKPLPTSKPTKLNTKVDDIGAFLAGDDSALQLDARPTSKPTKLNTKVDDIGAFLAGDDSALQLGVLPQKVGTGQSYVNLGLRGASSGGLYMGAEGVANNYAEKTKAEKKFYDGMAAKIGGTIGQKWKDVNEAFASLDPANWYADAVGDTRDAIDEALPVDADVAESLPGQIAQGLGQAAGTLPLYALPTVGITHTVGQVYQEGRDDYEQTQIAKGLPVVPSEAHKAGLVNAPSAALEVLADKLVIGKFLKPLKGKITVGELVKNVGVTFASGGAAEGAQTFWQNLNAKYLSGYDTDRKLDDQVIDSIIVGGIVDSAISNTPSAVQVGLDAVSDLGAPAGESTGKTLGAEQESTREKPKLDAQEQPKANPMLEKRIQSLDTEIAELEALGGELGDGLDNRQFNRLKIAKQLREDTLDALRDELGPANGGTAEKVDESAPVDAPKDVDIYQQVEGDLSQVGRDKLRSQIEQSGVDAAETETAQRVGAGESSQRARMARRRGLIRQIGDKPVYKWTDDEVQKLVSVGYVKARREQQRRNKPEYAKRLEKSVVERKAKALSDQPYEAISREDLEFLADRGDEGAVSALIRQDEQAELDAQNDPKDELLEAIRSVGGLPHPAELRKQGKSEALIAELENLYESTAEVRKQTSKKGKVFEKKVQPRGLWSKKNLRGLDDVRNQLQADYGFSWFDSPDDLINAVDERVREGKKIFPDWAMGQSQYENVNFARKRGGTEQSGTDADYMKAVEAGDMETAQAMVDAAAKAAGYDSPEVHHGTAKPFEAFDKSRLGGSTRASSAKQAFFFITDRRQAQGYGDYAVSEVTRGFIDEIERAEAANDWDRAQELTEQMEEFELYGDGNNSGHVFNVRLKIKNLEVIQQVGDYFKGGAKRITDAIASAKRNGKDGVLFKDLVDDPTGELQPADHYAIFESSQVKLTDPVTYDSEGNVIPLSQRFNESDPRITYSRTAEAVQPSKLNSFDLAKSLDPISKAWRGSGVSIEVVQHERDLPPVYRRMMRGQEGENEGFFDASNGRTFLIADNLDSLDRAKQVLFHEVVGHRGMREILGERYEDFMHSVYRRAEATEEMADIFDTYGLDRRSDADWVTGAEEYIARMAEGDVSDPGLMRRIVQAVREWLRNLGFDLGEISEGDIRAALVAARQQLEAAPDKGQGGNQPAVAMSKGRLDDRRSESSAENVQFSRKKLTTDLNQLMADADALTLQIENDKAAGRSTSREVLGKRARLRAQIADAMAYMQRSVEGLDAEGTPVANEVTAGERRNNARSDLEAATHAPETDAANALRQIKRMFAGFKSSLPELPNFGKWHEKPVEFFTQFREGYRRIIAATDEVRKQAEEDVAHVLEPIRELGRTAIDANSVERWRKLVKQRTKRREAGAEVPKSMDAEIETLEEKLANNPYYLFQNAVIYRDLWYRSLMHNKDGKPLKLPSGIEAVDVRARLGELHNLIAEHEDGEMISEALKRHYALVEGLQQDLLDHGQIIPEDLRNPLYFPHHVLENFSGKLGNVEAITAPAFRSYLLDPVGSVKAIEADYLKAIYHHVAQVRTHNTQQDLVEQYWKPYDAAAKVQADLEEQAAMEGGRVHPEAWKNPNNWPKGYRVFTVDDQLPLRMEYVIDRDTLARELGVALGDGDLRARMKELGVDLDLKPEMLQAALMAGEKTQWLLPEPVADALSGIKKRAEARNARAALSFGGASRAFMKGWKYRILFAPWNYMRYEFNNSLADTEKIFALEPRLFMKLPEAVRELREFYHGGEPTKEMKEAFSRGVIDSVTVQEAGQLKQFDQFTDFLTDGQLTLEKVKKLATWTTDIARYREGAVRYAKFKADVERMRGGAAPVYGGAYWKDVEARDGIYAKAAYISQRTFGDYSDLSVTGQWMREHMVPFYSWMEINLRYHANLFRNLKDMIAMQRWDEAKTAGKLQIQASAATAVGLMVRLALPYVAIQIWNKFGGPAMGLWDEDEDLESQLSEHDRRRLHIILGKDKEGKIMLVHTPTALSDVMEWFGGNKMANLFTDYASQRITAEQMFSDYAKTIVPDLVNKVLGGVRPDVKAAYMGLSRKNPFPDVLDQRTIGKDDLGWAILTGLTDHTTGLALRALLDEEYYSSKSFPEWVAQAIGQVRRRDPDQWAYYEIRDKTADWLEEKTGKSRGGFDYYSPDQQAIRNFRKAIYNVDIKSAIKFYNLLIEYGYTAERFRSSINSQDPLSGLSKADRREWEAQLNEHERDQLQRANQYYAKIAQSRGKEKMLFPTARNPNKENFQPRYTELIRLMTESMLKTEQEKEAFAEQLIGRSLK